MKYVKRDNVEWTQINEAMKIKFFLKDRKISEGNITFGIVHFPYGEAGKVHIHKEHDEVYIVLNGRGKANYLGEIYEIEKGDMVILEAGEEHAIIEGLTKEGIETFFALIPNKNK